MATTQGQQAVWWIDLARNFEAKHGCINDKYQIMAGPGAAISFFMGLQ